MKIPKHPPDSMDLYMRLASSDQGRLMAVHQASRDAASDGQYRHWDELRHRKPPSDLSREEWWVALKLARSPLLHTLPFNDVAGRPFRFGLPDPAPEHLHHIDQDAAGRIETAEPEITDPDTRDRYIVHSLIEEGITSSQLEGAATTRLVAKEMIRSKRKPRDQHEQMILNNYVAMKQIRQIQDAPLSAELLLKLHETLTINTLKNLSAVGRFRHPDEPVEVVDMYNKVAHTGPPAGELASRLEAMYAFANGETPDFFVHPVIRAIILHFWLAWVHPFVDGNGRCARGLFYWSMLHQRYWLCEYTSISHIIRKAPTKYARAFLYTETDENDLTYFILYHLKVIRRAIKELREHIDRKREQVRLTERLIRASRWFNRRQMALLSHALRHSDPVYTINSHMVSHNVVHQTARTDLLHLEANGLLDMSKAGRRLYFRPVGGLQEKLKALK